MKPRTGTSKCGWCLDGIHRPTSRSWGCTRYQKNHPGSCTCEHPDHDAPLLIETLRGAAAE